MTKKPAIYRRLALVFMILCALCACVRPSLPITAPQDALAPISWWRASALDDDMAFKDIAVAARQSLEYYQKLPAETTFFFGSEQATALDMTVTLRNFLLIIENSSLTDKQKLAAIKKDFVAYRSRGADNWGTVLFTGYYEPVISCRLKEDDTYRFPLYRRPNDIIEVDLTLFGSDFPKNKLFGRLDNKKVVPYYSREEIDQQGLLSGKGLEILWCADLVDIYLLQVQGSGKADLGGGELLSILYNGQNGRPYKSLGRHLIDLGLMTKETMSMQAIREYLRAHPEERNALLAQNPSYVFFRLDTGPSLGNIGVPLTPGRSIATDSKLLPKGALGFIVSQKPIIENGVIKSWAPFTRFVLNQDTGGAIKGPGRVDLFWGRGQDAELGAGYMQHEGELYFLMRKK